MDVQHEKALLSLYPLWPPAVMNGRVVFTLQCAGTSDSLQIQVPEIAADFNLIAGTSYKLDVFRSNHWQEHVYSNVRAKINSKVKSIGYLFPLLTLINPDSVLTKEGISKLSKAENEEANSLSGQVRKEAPDEPNIFDSAKPADEFAQGHAIAAIYELLKGAVGQKEKHRPVLWGETYELNEFYADDLVLAIYVPARINVNPAIAEQQIRQFSMTYASFKTYEICSGDLKAKLPSASFNGMRYIHVKECKRPSILPIVEYLKQHIIKLESTKCDPLIRFFLQYQFFELVMHEVFSCVIKDFLEQVRLPKFNENAWKTKDLVSKLNEKSSEAYRMSKIFSFLAKEFKDETAALEQDCLRLLENVDKSKPVEDDNNANPEVKNPYYKVRNIIFHGFGANIIPLDDVEKICDAVGEIIFKFVLEIDELGPYFEA